MNRPQENRIHLQKKSCVIFTATIDQFNKCILFQKFCAHCVKVVSLVIGIDHIITNIGRQFLHIFYNWLN